MTAPSVPASSYIDWTFYNGTFGGAVIPQAAFTAQLALVATRWIDRLTYGRALPIITANTDTNSVAAIKYACCAVAEELYNQALASNEDNIQSESQGEYSVSYGKTAQNAKSNLTKCIRAAKFWLEDTQLMFPGFMNGEYGSGFDANLFGFWL